MLVPGISALRHSLQLHIPALRLLTLQTTVDTHAKDTDMVSSGSTEHCGSAIVSVTSCQSSHDWGQAAQDAGTLSSVSIRVVLPGTPSLSAPPTVYSYHSAGDWTFASRVW